MLCLRNIIIIIIIIIIYHKLGLNSPVSSSSNSPYKGLPSRLPPFVYISVLFKSVKWWAG